MAIISKDFCIWSVCQQFPDHRGILIFLHMTEKLDQAGSRSCAISDRFALSNRYPCPQLESILHLFLDDKLKYLMLET